jgi:RND family efflux transporter MFP subunit
MRAALALAEAQLEAARQAIPEVDARLDEARRVQARRDRLAKDGLVTAAEIDTANADVLSLTARIAALREQVRVAEQQVALQRTSLDDMIIRAPFSGVAISKDAQPGEMVSPVSAGGGFTRTGISTIVDMASLEIEVDVNEAYLQRVTSGQKVRATLDAYPEAPFAAHLITVIPSADRDKATVKVRIGFDQLDPRILPDMGVKVAFLADEQAGGSGAGASGGSRTVRIARSALRDEGSDKILFVVRPDGTLERRAVSVALGTGDLVEVTAGLRAGEKVVVEGPATLAAGTHVREMKSE